MNLSKAHVYPKKHLCNKKMQRKKKTIFANARVFNVRFARDDMFSIFIIQLYDETEIILRLMCLLIAHA